MNRDSYVRSRTSEKTLEFENRRSRVLVNIIRTPFSVMYAIFLSGSGRREWSLIGGRTEEIRTIMRELID